MKFLKPETLDDARKIIDKVAESGGGVENKGLIDSIKELSDKTQKMIEIWDQIIAIGSKVCDFFADAFYCVTHPLEFFGALQPWLLIVLFAAIILKAIGFDVDKYIFLIVILLALVIIFC